MDPNEPSGGIPSRISGLLYALMRHVLALTELAAEETRILIRQSVTAIILLIALIVVLIISYLSLLATVIILLTINQGWGWPSAFAVMAAVHLVMAVLIVSVLRVRTALNPFEATTAELRRDLDHLGNYAKKSPHRSS
jgi:uncharacterized membrane protein YqjE